MVESAGQARRMRAALGRPVDVLIGQFSYANWIGNPEAIEQRRVEARKKLAAFERHCAMFAPVFVIPSASFVWFCHEENAFMNDTVTTVQVAVDCVSETTAAVPVVLYPGDRWTAGEPHDSSDALAKYAADYARAMQSQTLVSSPSVPIPALIEQAAVFCAQIRGGTRGLLLRLRERVLLLRTTHIYLTDHQQSLVLDTSSLRPAAIPRDACDVALSSAALSYVLCNLWGGDTLDNNGRFSVPPGGDHDRFRRYGIFASNLSLHGSYRAFIWDGMRKTVQHPGAMGMRFARRMRWLPGPA
jgi:hypothetical protein